MGKRGDEGNALALDGSGVSAWRDGEECAVNGVIAVRALGHDGYENGRAAAQRHGIIVIY